MRKQSLFLIPLLYCFCLGSSCQKSASNATKVQLSSSESDHCFDIDSPYKCNSECIPFIVDAHKITATVYNSEKINTTAPLEVTTTDLLTMIGERTCEDNWRIKLSNIGGSVSLAIQDSANVPGYYSSALIMGILNDTRFSIGAPIKFTFVEALNSSNVIHFIFKVDYANPSDVAYFNVSDLPT